MTIPDFFEQDRTTVEAALQELLPPEDALPITIHQAMRYSVFAGGKRVRPILCMEAARMFSQEQNGAVQVGCALEQRRPAARKTDQPQSVWRGDGDSGGGRAADFGVS
jgi:geranylgeranyl pyrophosphate synthase